LASITPGIESNPGKENAGIKTPSPLLTNDWFSIVALAARHAIPTLYWRREFAEVGGLCFFLALLASPFKSKSRLEAENAATPTSTDCAAAEGERSRPTHERRRYAILLTAVISELLRTRKHAIPTEVAITTSIAAKTKATTKSHIASIERHS